MTTHKEALTLALEALEDLNGMAQFFPDELYSDHPDVMKAAQAITAIKEALAQPEQEPVAWMSPNKKRLEFSRADTVYGSHTIPLYTTPPQRTWVGLTDEEIDGCDWGQSERDHAKAVEAKLKEKNNA